MLHLRGIQTMKSSIQSSNLPSFAYIYLLMATKMENEKKKKTKSEMKCDCLSQLNEVDGAINSHEACFNLFNSTFIFNQ